VGGALLIVAVMLFQNWAELVAFQWEVNYLSAVWSLVLCIATWLLFGFNWTLMTQKLGSEQSLRDGMRLYYLSSVAKFIPGRIWYVASRVYVYSLKGVSKTVTSLALIIETALLILSGTIVYALAFLLSPVSHPFEGWEFLPFLIIIPLVIILVYPSFLITLVNSVLTRLGRARVSPNLSYRDTLLWLILYAFNWCVGGAVLYYLTNTLWAVSPSHFPVMLEGVCLSGVISLIFIVIPVGLGAREIALVYLLSPPIPMPVAIASSLVFRIWLILGEVACLVILGFPRKSGHDNKPGWCIIPLWEEQHGKEKTNLHT
jgi:uncharacterized membrane protein YbhN (UPF0104 family)